MSAFQLNDHVRYLPLTPEGPLSGSGVVTRILPGGHSHWLHVQQDDGHVRMLFEATTVIEVVELEAA